MASPQQRRKNPKDSTSSSPPTSSSSVPLYPTIDMSDLVGNLFPDPHSTPDGPTPSHSPSSSASLLGEAPIEETLIRVPGAVLHLIDSSRSVELASGTFSVVALRQGRGLVAAFARVSDAIQWPLARDEPAVRLDPSHYFFSLRDPDDPSGPAIHYGLTFASKGQEALLRELDAVLARHSAFSAQEVATKGEEVLEGRVAKGTSPGEAHARKEVLEREASAYWTTLAPNVEEYGGSIARLIAKGSGKVAIGILWCGDVTAERLRWGNEYLRKRMSPGEKAAEVSPETMKRIQRVKKMTKMSDKVVSGILSGVVKVSGVVTSSVVNSKAGKKFFGLLPGEIVLASLDGFAKVCDAVEAAGKNVLSTSSTVTTELVSHRYGDRAAEATHEGLDAAGHAIGTAWAVFKVRKALNPKNAMKPTSLVKAAAADLKNKKKNSTG